MERSKKRIADINELMKPSVKPIVTKEVKEYQEQQLKES
jgi:hypothetical protein